MSFTKWKTVVALILLILTIVFQWWWFFSILFILQIVVSILTGKVEYVETIERKEHPFLFWVLIITFSFLAIYSIFPILNI